MVSGLICSYADIDCFVDIVASGTQYQSHGNSTIWLSVLQHSLQLTGCVHGAYANLHERTRHQSYPFCENWNFY